MILFFRIPFICPFFFFFFRSSCWANQLHRAVGAFTSAELCFPVLLLYLERYYSHLCISVEHFSGFSSLALGPIFLSRLFSLFFSASFDSLHSMVSKVQGQGLTRPRWFVCWLVVFFAARFLALMDLDSCFLLFRLVNRDMLLYVDDFSGSLLCIGLSFFIKGFCFYLYS